MIVKKSILKWTTAGLIIVAFLAGVTVYVVWALFPKTWYAWTGELEIPQEQLAREAEMAKPENVAQRVFDQAPPEPKAEWSPRNPWYRKNVLEAFESFGEKDAAGVAKRMIHARCRRMADDGAATGDEDEILLIGTSAAKVMGARDPLMWAMVEQQEPRYFTMGMVPHLDPFEEAERAKNSSYHPLWKCIGMLRWAERAVAPDPGKAPKARELADAALDFIPAIGEDADLPAARLCGLIEIIGETSIALHGDRETLVGKALALLEKSKVSRSRLLTTMGQHFIDHAWDARGSGLAITVTADRWKLFHERIALARTSLEEAWEKDNSNYQAALLMITVELADDKGGRAAMEKWYARAAGCNPYHYRAALAKLNYLEPKWHGDAAAMLAFGEQLAKTDSADPRLPMIFPEAVWTLSQYVGQTRGGPNPDFYKKTADPLWPPLQSCYERYLKRVPDSYFHRTRYAAIAEWCGHPDVAVEQRALLGTHESRFAVPRMDGPPDPTTQESE